MISPKPGRASVRYRSGLPRYLHSVTVPGEPEVLHTSSLPSTGNRADAQNAEAQNGYLQMRG